MYLIYGIKHNNENTKYCVVCVSTLHFFSTPISNNPYPLTNCKKETVKCIY